MGSHRYEYHMFSSVSSSKRDAWKPRRKGYGRTVLYAVTFVAMCIFA